MSQSVKKLHIVKSFNVESFNVKSSNVKSSNVESFNVESFNVKSFKIIENGPSPPHIINRKSNSQYIHSSTKKINFSYDSTGSPKKQEEPKV